MALISSDRPPTDIEQLIERLLEQRDNVQEQECMLAELRESVRQYEERYGMPSACIHDAIDAGELVEDQDVGHWMFNFDLLQRVEK